MKKVEGGMEEGEGKKKGCEGRENKKDVNKEGCTGKEGCER